MQERRHLDLVYNFGSHLTDHYMPGKVSAGINISSVCSLHLTLVCSCLVLFSFIYLFFSTHCSYTCLHFSFLSKAKDPALSDPALQRKLRSNREVALSRLEEVITKYAVKQEDTEEQERTKRQEKDSKGKEVREHLRKEENHHHLLLLVLVSF